MLENQNSSHRLLKISSQDHIFIIIRFLMQRVLTIHTTGVVCTAQSIDVWIWSALSNHVVSRHDTLLGTRYVSLLRV